MTSGYTHPHLPVSAVVTRLGLPRELNMPGVSVSMNHRSPYTSQIQEIYRPL